MITDTWFSFFTDQDYETSSSTQGNPKKRFYKINTYGKYSITVRALKSWNKFQKQLKNTLIKDLSPQKIKIIIFILNNLMAPAKIYMTFLAPIQSNYFSY